MKTEGTQLQANVAEDIRRSSVNNLQEVTVPVRAVVAVDWISHFLPPKAPNVASSDSPPTIRCCLEQTEIPCDAIDLRVQELHRHLDAVIAGGKNIRAAQAEHQEHVGRPDADAFDLG